MGGCVGDVWEVIGMAVKTDLVWDILVRHNVGYSAQELADMNGVGINTVYRILNGQTHRTLYEDFCDARTQGRLPARADLPPLVDLRAERRDRKGRRDSKRRKRVDGVDSTALNPRMQSIYEEMHRQPSPPQV